MAEPLKLMYNAPFAHTFGSLVQAAWPPFDVQRFVALVEGDGWEELELKGRMRRLTTTLGELLPPEYEEAVRILCLIDEKCTGFPYLIFPEFIEIYGGAEEHWELSMAMLERFTKRSSSEFAIRPFILANPERTLARMLEWAESEDEHVRRLASEGCRPRLPWAPALPMLKKDPSPALPILERLKADESLYVRKSVANHLNDISKDNPAVVVELSQRWYGQHPLTDWIVRKGCRTLVKQAEPAVLAIFGYGADALPTAVAGEDTEPGAAGYALLQEPAALSVDKTDVHIGEASMLRYDVQLSPEAMGRVRLEYGVDYVRLKGKRSHKRFLIADKPITGETRRLSGEKRIVWQELSTRKLWPGEHRISLWVNGKEQLSTSIMLHADGKAEPQ
ncbi:heat-repeat protein [Paenibacillus curdlanolyticus YK9]|uniref:Heat-repeat protein n=1 Tax=Paenibacillus curdlanolyticus YK9 TaxID=717606 RepID=E0IB74_9BACL|nr:DNA alkylation repair protein [Paenibacillus curdlanolyticus]EFM10365.1 heat-repeat protein [Paenibacillus curdlanolyticus YK9]